MKKILFAFMAVGLLFSASSCKKCGYCKDQYGQAGNNSSSVCKNNTFGGLLDEYEQAESQCAADQGTWVVTK